MRTPHQCERGCSIRLAKLVQLTSTCRSVCWEVPRFSIALNCTSRRRWWWRRRLRLRGHHLGYSLWISRRCLKGGHFGNLSLDIISYKSCFFYFLKQNKLFLKGKSKPQNKQSWKISYYDGIDDCVCLMGFRTSSGPLPLRAWRGERWPLAVTHASLPGTVTAWMVPLVTVPP